MTNAQFLARFAARSAALPAVMTLIGVSLTMPAPPVVAATGELKVVVGFAAGSGVTHRAPGRRGCGVHRHDRHHREPPWRCGPRAARRSLNPIRTAAPSVRADRDDRLHAVRVQETELRSAQGPRADTRVGNFKFTLAVNNDVPANTVQEFVAYVKANPGKVSYATPGPGTPAHFLGAMFNKATGTDLLHVPYRGSGPAALALLGGEVPSAINTTVAWGPLYKDKKVKLLAVTGLKRSPTLPDVPTFGELKMNLGDIESAEIWYGFLTQGRTRRLPSASSMPWWSRR